MVPSIAMKGNLSLLGGTTASLETLLGHRQGHCAWYEGGQPLWKLACKGIAQAFAAQTPSGTPA